MGNTTHPPQKNAVLKLFQRTITFPTKWESLKIIDFKIDWMGYVIVPTLRTPKGPLEGFEPVCGPRPQATFEDSGQGAQHLQEKGMISKASLTEGISWRRIP